MFVGRIVGGDIKSFSGVYPGGLGPIINHYDLRTHADSSITTYSGGGTAAVVYNINKKGRVTDTRIADLPNFSASFLRGSPQLSAVDRDGNLLVAGQKTYYETFTASHDGALVRISNTDSLRAKFAYTFGEPGGIAYHNAHDLLERPGGGVYLLRETADSLYLRALDGSGRAVRADVKIGGDLALNVYYGGAVTPSGDIVIMGIWQSQGIDKRVLLRRVDVTGRILAEHDFGPFRELSSSPNQSPVFIDRNGQITAFSSKTFIYTDTDIITFNDNLEPIQKVTLHSMRDTFHVITSIVPIPGSEDLLIGGDASSASNPFVWRVSPTGKRIWRRIYDTGRRSRDAISQIVLRPDSTIAVLTAKKLGSEIEYYDVQVLDFNSTIVSDKTYASSGNFTYAPNVQTEGGSPVFMSLRDVKDDARGFRYRQGEVLRLDLADGSYRSVMTPSKDIRRQVILYREFGGHTYLAGYQQTGSGSQVFVSSFAGSLSPTGESFRPATAPWLVYPNPVSSGQVLYVATDAAEAMLPRAIEVYDAFGRHVGTVGVEAGAVSLPALPSGGYRLVGRLPGGRTLSAALIVR